MIEVTHTLADFVGALAGALAVSIALYLQVIKARLYTKGYIAAFYIVGVLLLMTNIEPALNGTGYWAITRIVSYAAIIAVEFMVVWDLRGTNDSVFECIHKEKE